MTSGLSERSVSRFLLGAMLVVAVLMALHLMVPDLSSGGVKWFHLDKERNVPTWISGVVFFLIGTAAFAIFGVESYGNTVFENRLKLPWLWIVVGATCCLLSMDEILILHENLFWREVRELSLDQGGMWTYLTQWLVVFAPLIAATFIFLILFFGSRLRNSPRAMRMAFLGIGCWGSALTVESVREALKSFGARAYDVSVILEEGLELAGSILLLSALMSYLAFLHRSLNNDGGLAWGAAAKPASRKVAAALGVFVIVGALLVSVAMMVAKRQSDRQAPLPRLQRITLEDESGS